MVDLDKLEDAVMEADGAVISAHHVIAAFRVCDMVPALIRELRAAREVVGAVNLFLELDIKDEDARTDAEFKIVDKYEAYNEACKVKGE